ncbi:hypothetical protein OQA88_9020 [Cercophora sp. LCS_1]
MALGDAFILGAVVQIEHRQFPGPSDLVSVYLITAILCDALRLNLPSTSTVPVSVLARCLAYSLLLGLEYLPRGPPRNSRKDFVEKSAEEESSLLSRVFFHWINPILAQGYQNILVNSDLPPLSQDVKPATTRPAILQAWSQRKQPETTFTLPLTLLRCLKPQFLSAIPPRLFLILFRYSQPILIRQSIRYVTTTTSSSPNHGYWLIVSAITIYTGLALSTALYEHRLNRLKITTSSALISLIHAKTLSSPSSHHDNNSEAITLMSTDASTLQPIFQIIHEIWAQSISVIIGIVLLYIQVGWLFPLPLIFIFFSSRVSRYVATHLQPRQREWNEATQRRVASISAFLASTKAVIMLGISTLLGDKIQRLREDEMYAASRVRWINVWYNASANALGIFLPAVTLVLFAVWAGVRGGRLDTETAFTTMAVLGMVTHPANMVMTWVPRVVAAMAGFERIQGFLVREGRVDGREVLGGVDEGGDDDGVALRISGLQIGDKEPPLLRGVDIEVKRGSLVVFSGPVGCGKSTLLRAVLGEVAPVCGTVGVAARRIAYCGQTPWLPSGSIRDVVRGASSGGDDAWYDEVVEACCLTPDLKALPDGDGTQVGSEGLNLSGGQRQRVALARAVFARCEIVLLDDSFSALDGETENKVFGNLFGQSGLLRQTKTTVVLATNSTQFFPLADHIVILGDGGIKEQGKWDEIKSKTAIISKFIPKSHAHDGDAVALPNLANLSAKLRAKEEAEVDLARKTGDLSLYKYYFQFTGLLNLFLIAALNASCGFFFTAPQYWLKLWTESGTQSAVFYICGFLGLSFFGWASTSTMMWVTVIRLAPSSGLRLHRRLLDIVTGAPLSFFSGNDNGSILNRFSQDVQLVDKQLPVALQSLGVQIFKLLVQVIVLLVTQKLLGLSLPICMAVVYVVQKVYLRTSRQLRFIELESRAAVFSSFLESVGGIETIRAFGWQEQAIQDYIARLDTAQRPEFLLMSLQRWLNIVLDLMAAGIATSIIALAVVLRGTASGGEVGVGLNVMLVTNTTLLSLVAAWTTLEVSLGAVSRVKILEKTTPQELDGDDVFDAPNNWPEKGGIVLKDVTASYRADAVALRGFNLTIEPGQRTILCGRTGSGKSSVLLTLLRMLDLRSGTIQIDGIDINKIPRAILRRRCFITVAQDALLLSGETLRFNLDPEDATTDEALIQALESTGLWSHFRGDLSDDYEYRDHPVLDSKMASFPALSAGQSQLFAICRAVVRVGVLRAQGARPVVLLDEATAALDTEAEARIHGIVEQEFVGNGHTVVMVSHRIGGLVDDLKVGRDVVVGMRDGKVQEIIGDVGCAALKGIEED